ncbi:nucleotidyltransferase [bacterium]|nr:nucleotidyltransferase [bacterium]
MKTEKLLSLLRDNKVEFVLIGAVTFPVYGYSRSTLDTDIFIRPTIKNARNTLISLEEFGYDVSSLTPELLLKKKTLIRQYIVETDIHPFVKGISFEEVWENKVENFFGKQKVYFASLEDIIKMKKAAGRVKDREDLKVLKRLLKQERPN